jgi:hypothetical protein
MKSLYGLKQAGRLWNELLHQVLTDSGYTRCLNDLCLYYKRDEDGLTVIGVYVDDLLVTATSEERKKELFERLRQLQVKNLGAVTKFLGMRVAHDTKGYKIDQEPTIDQLVTEYGLGDAYSVRTPIDASSDDGENEELLPPKSRTEGAPTVKTFQSLAGSLLWLARCTRPDIMFAVHRMTRKTHQPRICDWKLGKRILRYLKGTKNFKLHMKSDNEDENVFKMTSYSDADYAADREDRKSVSGIMVLLNGCLIGWTCQKQGGVALSTMEAEFVSAARACQELMGLREMLTELKLSTQLPMKMCVDNQAAICQIMDEASSAKSKHIDTKIKYVKICAKQGIVEAIYCPTNEMWADLLTKPLPSVKLLEMLRCAGLCADTEKRL